MSRPIKKGLSYFPMDTDFMRDLKIQRLLLEYGCEGLSVFLAVLCEAYASEGYYVDVKGGFYPAIGFQLGIKEEKVKQIIYRCLELELFDQDLFDGELILTSHGIQRRYGVISRQTKNRIKEEFNLTRKEDFQKPEKPSHSNINKNINERLKGNENENENRNKNTTGKNYEKGRTTNAINSDAARRDELLRMAANATANHRNA